MVDEDSLVTNQSAFSGDVQAGEIPIGHCDIEDVLRDTGAPRAEDCAPSERLLVLEQVLAGLYGWNVSEVPPQMPEFHDWFTPLVHPSQEPSKNSRWRTETIAAQRLLPNLCAGRTEKGWQRLAQSVRPQRSR
jgi:hypothetical protein